jgi:hypothetical protein
LSKQKEVPMGERFEYEFVRLEGREQEKYRETVHEYARKGWRLVQVLAPGAGGLWGSATYVELILERKVKGGRGDDDAG